MKNIEEMIDEINMKIYEISSLNKCICDSLQCYVSLKEDYSHLLPISKISCKRIDKLTNDFSELESVIYKSFFIMIL